MNNMFVITMIIFRALCENDVAEVRTGPKSRSSRRTFGCSAGKNFAHDKFYINTDAGALMLFCGLAFEHGRGLTPPRTMKTTSNLHVERFT